MASITTATSGLASATSTWTGSVVPGTTFAGTRTTGSAGYAVGATTIALSAASPAVTAGKWLKFAGHTTMHRVATGLGTGAGNIVLDAPGLLESIPAAPTNVSVDMTDDKVTIAHPGTNNLAAGTQYTTNTAGYAIGATSITLITGTNTIVAGECVQFGSDPVYYKVSKGITGPGTLVLAAPGLVTAIPAAATAVVNRGHVVEMDIPYAVWGGDTSSLTSTANGIVVNGTLKASRSTSTTLACRGTMFRATGSTVDWGRPTLDPIPAGINATLVLNDSATQAAGKHGMSDNAQSGVTLWVAGAVLTRNTTLTSGTSAGATSITVAASANWVIGGTVVIASDTDDAARAQNVLITGGSSPTWTVAAITNARASGTRVGYLSSNVTIKPPQASVPSFVTLLPLATDTTANAAMSDFAMQDMGSASSWVTVQANVVNQGALTLQGGSAQKYTVTRPAFYGTTTAAIRALTMGQASLNRHSVVDAAISYLATSGSVVNLHTGANMDLDAVLYRVGAGAFSISSDNSDGSAGMRLSGAYWGTGSLQLLRFIPSVALTFAGAELRTSGGLLSAGNGSVTFDSCIVNASPLVGAATTGTQGNCTYNNCTVSAGALSATLITGNRPSQDMRQRFTAVNGTASDNRDLSYYRLCTTDTTTRLHGTYSVAISPKVANTAITYTFTLPAVSGVAQVVKGSLRFDATYGTANPPSIVLSGQGVTQSFTCTATAGAWFDFSFSFTPTSTGDITATVTVQSASTSGFAWLDGVYHYPMIQAVRHFGFLWLPKAAQDADPSITVSEATALAYPVAVNHGTSTITVSGNATARQVYEACMADLCATANNAVAQHISTTDAGASFTTTYTVALSGGAVITGNYTDATGVHVVAAATLPITGCRVQLYDVTNTVELDNQVVTGTSYLFPLTYTGARTLRLRVAYQSGATAKLPQEVLAALTAVGATFTVPDETDAVYVANAIDGSTCTEVTASYPDLHIDTSDGDGTTSWQRIYAWARFAGMAADGIRLMHNAVQAQDVENYLIDVASVDAHIDNTTGTPLLIVGAYGRRSDGTTVIASTSGSIQMDPGRAYIASTAGVATDVWAAATRTLTAGTNIVLAKGTGVTGFNDPTAAANADALLARSIAGGADGGRTVQDALRANRNKTALVGGTLTVYQEDDATPAWTAAVTTASRDPVSGIDPA